MSEKPKDSAELVGAIQDRVGACRCRSTKDDPGHYSWCPYPDALKEAIALVDEHQRGLRETVKALAGELRADGHGPQPQTGYCLATHFKVKQSECPGCAALQRAEEELSR